MTEVAVWPNNTWCHLDELWEMSFMSDDYSIVDVPETEEDIEAFILKLEENT